MTQFHKGQEVEVLRPVSECSDHAIWRKAKVIHYFDNLSKNAPETYGVQFPDGSRAVFDAEHIRALPTDEARQSWAEACEDCYEHGDLP